MLEVAAAGFGGDLVAGVNRGQGDHMVLGTKALVALLSGSPALPAGNLHVIG
jgi:hypothetical protein